MPTTTLSGDRRYKKKIAILDEKSTPIARANRLKMLRNLANLSRKNLCGLSGVNINTLKGWERGKYGGLPLDGAEKVIETVVSRGVKCSLDWLIYEIGAGPATITDFAKAHEEIKNPTKHDSLGDEEMLILNEILFFRKQFNHTIDFLIEDDGMHPIYNQNEYVAGIKRYREDIRSLIGANCIVRLKSGRILLRQLRRGEEENKYSLTCINPNAKVSEPLLPNVEIASAAPILRHFRKNFDRHSREDDDL